MKNSTGLFAKFHKHMDSSQWIYTYLCVQSELMLNQWFHLISAIKPNLIHKPDLIHL